MRFLVGLCVAGAGLATGCGLVGDAQAQFVNSPPPPPPPVFNPSTPHTVPQPSYTPITPRTPVSPATPAIVPQYEVTPTVRAARRASVVQTSPVERRRHRIVVRPALKAYPVVCGYAGCVRTYPWAFPCQYYSAYCGPLFSYRSYAWYRS
jgi:hypothetical protein